MRREPMGKKYPNYVQDARYVLRSIKGRHVAYNGA